MTRQPLQSRTWGWGRGPFPPPSVQQHVAAGEPQVVHGLRRGRQVVARGGALVESSGRSK